MVEKQKRSTSPFVGKALMSIGLLTVILTLEGSDTVRLIGFLAGMTLVVIGIMALRL